MSYVYNCEHWCDSCGNAIMKELDLKGEEDNGDSDEYPQYFDGSITETDCPCHCASGEECLEAEYRGKIYNQYKDTVEEIKYGAIVCERLTTDGINYVLECHKKRQTGVTYTWLSAYDIPDPFTDEDQY